MNPKTYGNNKYKFEGRRLVEFTKGSSVYKYKYNEQGLRTEKTGPNGTTKFYYDGQLLVTEIAPTYRLDFLYDENNQLYGFIKDNTATYYYVRDCLMTIIGIVDSNGNLVVKYSQTAYGNVVVLSDTCGISSYNPFRYKGYYYDSESGMYYCNSRYYVSEWGRWLNADSPLYLSSDIKSINLFTYCQSNPVNNIDPSGCFIITIGALLTGLTYLFYFLIGAAIIGGIAYIESETHILENAINATVDALQDAIDALKNTFTTDSNEIIPIEGITSVIIQERNPDPWGRAGQKKQGRELKTKARLNSSWKDRSGYRRGPKRPKKHTPGRDHRHFLILLGLRGLYELFKELDMDRL